MNKYFNEINWGKSTKTLNPFCVSFCCNRCCVNKIIDHSQKFGAIIQRKTNLRKI